MTYKDSFAYIRGYYQGIQNGIIEGREQTTIYLLSKFKKVLDEEIIAFAEKTNYTPYQITAMIDAEAKIGRGIISEKEYDDFLKDLLHLEAEFGGIVPEGSVTSDGK